MSYLIKPTDCRVRSALLEGFNVTGFVQCARVFESLCKPYLTVQLILIDNDNVIDNLGIQGMWQLELAFDSPPSADVYECTTYLLQMSSHQSPTNLKTQIYEIDFVGAAYFNDKKNLVQKASKDQGTSLIGAIWGQYLAPLDAGINIPVQSQGMLGTEKEKSNINHMKPFAAIDQIRKYLKFDSPSLLFRDRHIANLVPFNHLFNGSSQMSFLQKETWGINFRDPDWYNAVIVAEAEVDKNFNGEGMGGRGGSKDLAKTAVQGRTVFDLFTGVLDSVKQAGQIGGAAGGSLAGGGGGLGGAPNIMHNNSNLWDKATAPFTKAMEDQQFASEIKNGPQLKLKVPLQTGISVTVGKGITVQLIPPTGDYFGAGTTSSQSGWWLVKDICHEAFTDKRDVKGTTTMQCIRKGYQL